MVKIVFQQLVVVARCIPRSHRILVLLVHIFCIFPGKARDVWSYWASSTFGLLKSIVRSPVEEVLQDIHTLIRQIWESIICREIKEWTWTARGPVFRHSRVSHAYNGFSGSRRITLCFILLTGIRWSSKLALRCNHWHAVIFCHSESRVLAMRRLHAA